MTRRMLWVLVLALGCGKKEEAAKSSENPADAATIAANERYVIGSLKTIATAEAHFRSNDQDNDRMRDFWTGDVAGLYAIDDTSTGAANPSPIKLIEVAIALADQNPTSGTLTNGNYSKAISEFGTRGPHKGYWFRALVKDSQVEANGGNGIYAVDTDTTGDLVHNTSRFGFCAVPAEYGKTGKRIFIVNENVTIFSRDFGKDALKSGKTPPELGDVFDANWPTDKDLAEKWTKVD